MKCAKIQDDNKFFVTSYIFIGNGSGMLNKKRPKQMNAESFNIFKFVDTNQFRCLIL